MTETENIDDLRQEFKDDCLKTWYLLTIIGKCCDPKLYELDELNEEEVLELIKKIRRMHISLELMSEKYIPENIWIGVNCL